MGSFWPLPICKLTGVLCGLSTVLLYLCALYKPVASAETGDPTLVLFLEQVLTKESALWLSPSCGLQWPWGNIWPISL